MKSEQITTLSALVALVIYRGATGTSNDGRNGLVLLPPFATRSGIGLSIEADKNVVASVGITWACLASSPPKNWNISTYVLLIYLFKNIVTHRDRLLEQNIVFHSADLLYTYCQSDLQVAW